MAQAPDIYQTHEVTRQIYSIRAEVEPGNSGGPLLAPNGQVYGVVFAAAVSVKNIGYALTASEVRPTSARARPDHAGVHPGLRLAGPGRAVSLTCSSGPLTAAGPPASIRSASRCRPPRYRRRRCRAGVRRSIR